MKPFAHTRTKRNTAFMVLLVWLFALASSVANACFLEADEPHQRTAEVSAAAADHAPDAFTGHGSADANQRDDSGGSTEACLKVCDDGTHTLPKAQSGADHTDPGPATLVATLWIGAPNVVSAPRRLDEAAIPPVGPPLRVRYARLAL